MIQKSQGGISVICKYCYWLKKGKSFHEEDKVGWYQADTDDVKKLFARCKEDILLLVVETPTEKFMYSPLAGWCTNTKFDYQPQCYGKHYESRNF